MGRNRAGARVRDRRGGRARRLVRVIGGTQSKDRPQMSFARFRSAALGVAWRNLHNYFTNPAFLIPSILFPLFFFTAFAGGLSTLGDAPGFHYRGGYTAFQFAFVII